ncbi:MAG TPA: ABC transporter permease [Acetobacteraceae bacterium]|nr:ABC transporter permease [Acetobacteraceae bacterium]
MPPESSAMAGIRASEAHHSRRPRAAHAIGQNIGLILAAAILILSIIIFVGMFVIQQGRLPGNFEITSTVNNTMPLALAAIGQTIVVLTRGIDLSVGGIVDLTNALAAIYLAGSVAHMALVAVLVVLVGAMAGLVNGLLVGLGRLQPIVVTLATLSIFQGLAIRVLPQPGGTVPDGFTALLVNTNGPFALFFLVLAALGWMALRRSRLGVDIFSIGNDEPAAIAHGVNVVRTKVLAYTIGGALYAVAGLFLAANATSGDATSGNVYTLTSIVATVLGGVSLFGGRGSAVGSICGAFITTMIVNILFYAHINPLYQSFYEGLFLVIAVVLGAAIGRLVRGGRA